MGTHMYVSTQKDNAQHTHKYQCARMSLCAPYVFITLARQLNVVCCVIYYTAPSLSRTTPREFDIHASVRVQCVFIYLYVYDRSLARAARRVRVHRQREESTKIRKHLHTDVVVVDFECKSRRLSGTTLLTSHHSVSSSSSNKRLPE